jgi:hypothetical protein
MEDQRLCGLCGNFAGDLLTAHQCWPTTPQGAARSFRLATNCSAPAAPQVTEEKCASTQDSSLPTAVSGRLVFPDQLAECARSRHALVRLGRDQQVCLSQLPVAECGAQRHGCVTRATATKMVDFTCLGEGRTAAGYADTSERLYVKRAIRGEILPELRDDVTVNICFH